MLSHEPGGSQQPAGGQLQRACQAWKPARRGQPNMTDDTTSESVADARCRPRAARRRANAREREADPRRAPAVSGVSPARTGGLGQTCGRVDVRLKRGEIRSFQELIEVYGPLVTARAKETADEVVMDLFDVPADLS